MSERVLEALEMKDSPGKLPVAMMRKFFESAVRTTPSLVRLPLKIFERDGEFAYYDNAETDTMWMGFAIGLRCAERVELQGHLIHDLGVSEAKQP